MKRISWISIVGLCLAAIGYPADQALLASPEAGPFFPEDLPTLPAAAGAPPAFVFVSTFGTNQILKIDTTSGTVTTIHTGDAAFLPEDMAAGPDGKIYVADSSNVGQIIRMNDDGSDVETVFNASTTAGPDRPEGLSFLGNDLYINTRNFTHNGIWVIPGVAAVAAGPIFPAPVQLFTAAETGSTFGEGTAFANNGDLLIIDRSNDRVLVSSPPFDSLGVFPISLPERPAGPWGIAVNSTGDIFVSVQTPAEEEGPPFIGEILRFADDGAALGTYAAFPDTTPIFMEFDADDTLWVASVDNPNGSPGRLLKVDANGAASTIITGLSGGGGIAVPPTQTDETQTFDPDDEEQTFDFGSHQLKLGGDISGPPCVVTVTAVELSPQVVGTRFTTFFSNAECVRYPSKGGNCVVYEVRPSPLPACFSGEIDIVMKYFTVDEESEPAMLHDLPPNVVPGDFLENVLISYFPEGLPGDDPAMRGRTRNFSDFVAVNLIFSNEGIFQGFQGPLREGGRYKSGSNIPVKFRVVDDQGDPIVDASANIAVALIEPVFQIVDAQSAGKSSTGTAFEFTDDGNYLFSLKTTGYAKGIYAITVTSNVFPPQTIHIEIR